MRRFLFVILVSSLLFAPAFAHKENISSVKTSSTIYQGDLVLTGNNVTTIEGRFDINGSIIVKENATLILKNAIVYFIQTSHYQYYISFLYPANGNPRLFAENTSITSSWWFMIYFYHNSSGTLSATTFYYYLDLYDASAVSVVDSTIGYVRLFDIASLSVYNSMINNIEAYKSAYKPGSPHIDLYNSTIGHFLISPILVNCSLSNIYPGFISFWDYQLNASIVVAQGGGFPNLTIKISTINDWTLWFQISCNVTISDSTLYNLLCYTDSVAWLINVTSSRFQYAFRGRAYVSWYLDVHVIDSIGQDVPSTNVTAHAFDYFNNTVAESKLTDANGWARLTLMEKMANETGEYPVGNYTVEATYDVHSQSTTVNMTGNQVATVQLPFIIPEFPSFPILLIFIIATLLAVIVYKRNVHKQSKSIFEHYYRISFR